MTIVLFLVDTSASMGQKTYQGTSVLDLARAAVEAFLKAGWREGQAVFHEQLKNLKPRGLTSFGPALGAALRFVNTSRHTSLIDNYGSGRFPTYLEPVVIVAISDGGALNDVNQGILDKVLFAKPSSIGSELTEEPFRWDQRLFSLIFRLPGHAPKGAKFVPGTTPLLPDPGPIDDMCCAMGGRSYCVWTHRMLPYCIEAIVQRMQQGVLLRFERYGPLPALIIPTSNNHADGLTNGQLENGSAFTAGNNGKLKPDGDGGPDELLDGQQLVMVFSKIASRANQGVTGTGNWPIPEAFWPEDVNITLPPRKAHPLIHYRCENSDPLVCPDFPFDKYEMESCTLTQYILERKQPNVCWQLFVADSGHFKGLGHPFGYLKAATNLASVNLFIMPYNYPVLLPLIEEVKSESKQRLSNAWKMKFDKYLNTVPHYYLPHLRKAFTKMALAVMPEGGPGVDQQYSYAVRSYLTKVKHSAKEEFDSSCQAVAAALAQQGQFNNGNATTTVGFHLQFGGLFSSLNASRLSTMVPIVHRPLTQPRSDPPPTPKDHKRSSHAGRSDPAVAARDRLDRVERVDVHLPLNGNEFKGFQIHLREPRQRITVPSMAFRNPFEIRREKLLDQLLRMRANFEQQLRDSAIPVLEGGRPGQRIRLQHADDLHNLPIGQMGNYQDYVKGMEARGMAPLREVEPQAIRIHAFGNPFKIDKKNMLVDEVGEGAMLANAMGGGSGASGGSSSSGSAARIRRAASSASSTSSAASEGSRPPKRKPGPLSADFRTEWRARRRRRLLSSSAASSAGGSTPRSLSTDDEEDDRLSIASTSMSVDEEAGRASNQTSPGGLEATVHASVKRRRDSDEGSIGDSSVNRLRPSEPDYRKPPDSTEEQQLSVSGPPARKIPRIAINGERANSGGDKAVGVPRKAVSPSFLNETELNARRLKLSRIVKKPANASNVVPETLRAMEGLCTRDRRVCLSHTLNEARRFKRRPLADAMLKELEKLKKEEASSSDKKR